MKIQNHCRLPTLQNSIFYRKSSSINLTASTLTSCQTRLYSLKTWMQQKWNAFLQFWKNCFPKKEIPLQAESTIPALFPSQKVSIPAVIDREPLLRILEIVANAESIAIEADEAIMDTQDASRNLARSLARPRDQQGGGARTQALRYKSHILSKTDEVLNLVRTVDDLVTRATLAANDVRNFPAPPSPAEQAFANQVTDATDRVIHAARDTNSHAIVAAKHAISALKINTQILIQTINQLDGRVQQFLVIARRSSQELRQREDHADGLLSQALDSEELSVIRTIKNEIVTEMERAKESYSIAYDAYRNATQAVQRRMVMRHGRRMHE